MWFLFCSIASASSVYPGELAAAASMPCTPTCTVCHDSNAGGAGTVVQPFGAAMMDEGLTGGGDVASLTSALAAVAAAGVDGDGDGVADVDELAAGDDPNVDGGALCDGDVLTPTYGCVNHAPVPATGGVLALALGALLTRRRGGRAG